MLQRMAMNHPNTGLLHAQPPRAPPLLLARLDRLVIPEQHRRVAEHRLRAVQTRFSDGGVEGSGPAADVVVVFAVGVPGVDVEPAGGFVVEGEGADVLEDDLEDFANFARGRFGFSDRRRRWRRRQSKMGGRRLRRRREIPDRVDWGWCGGLRLMRWIPRLRLRPFQMIHLSSSCWTLMITRRVTWEAVGKSLGERGLRT